MATTDGAEKRIAYILGLAVAPIDHPKTINGDGNRVYSYGMEIIARQDFGVTGSDGDKSPTQRRAAYLVRKSTDDLTHTSKRHVLAAHRVMRIHNYHEAGTEGAYIVYR